MNGAAMKWLGRWWPAVLLVFGALWICSKMWEVTWWSSHENIWYPIRVHEYLESWRSGGWYPRWSPNLYGGYGYPFFNYYPPGVYAIGAALTWLVGSPLNALKIAMTLISVASVFSVFGLIRSETDRLDAALAGSALYVFFPYRCTDLYARGDLAEYSAYCLVPLALWAYRAIDRAPQHRIALTTTAAALVHAAVILTHTIIGFFATEMIGVYLVVAMIRRRRTAVAIGTALCFALLIAAIYLGPVLLERQFVQLERVTSGEYKSWLNMVHFRDLKKPFFTPGWPIAAAAVGWLCSWAAPETRGAAWRSAGWWLLAVFLFNLLMPWSRWWWHLVPFGREVQFPWRLYGFIGLFAAIGLGVVWRGWFSPRAGVVVAIAVTLAMPLFLKRQLEVYPERHIPSTVDEIRATHGSSTAMNEYLPRTVIDLPPPRTREAWSDDTGVVVDAVQIDGLTHRLSIDAPGPSTVVLAVFGFPGWQLRTLVGQPGVLKCIGRDGLLRVQLPRAGHYEVELHFGSNWVRLISSLLSLAALLTCFPVVRWLCRRLAIGVATGPVAAKTQGEGAPSNRCKDR
jgi:hypothetical protein